MNCSQKSCDQILFRYCNEHGEITAEANPNGSVENIAGVCNAAKNVFGMMPHPEIALSQMDHPDRFGADHFEQHRERLFGEEGDGLRLLKNIFKNLF